VSTEPTSLNEALASPHWKATMDVKYSALIKNKTWHLVPTPKGENIIDYRWIFKVKRKADGSL
jgi:histone deacetylase 1/2